MTYRSVLIFIPANNFSDLEFVTVRDTLLKKGFGVFITSDAHMLCVGSGGLKVKPDVRFHNINVNNFAAFILIGGNGVRGYWNNNTLHRTAGQFAASKKLIAAICSAPVILAKAGLLAKKEAVCYPEDKFELEKESVVFKNTPVAVSGNFITAASKEHSYGFADAIINYLSSAK